MHIVSNRFVDLAGSLVMHASSEKSGFWQQITCRFYIDNHLWKSRHDRDWLKSGHLPTLY